MNTEVLYIRWRPKDGGNSDVYINEMNGKSHGRDAYILSDSYIILCIIGTMLFFVRAYIYIYMCIGDLADGEENAPPVHIRLI